MEQVILAGIDDERMRRHVGTILAQWADLELHAPVQFVPDGTEGAATLTVVDGDVVAAATALAGLVGSGAILRGTEWYAGIVLPVVKEIPSRGVETAQSSERAVVGAGGISPAAGDSQPAAQGSDQSDDAGPVAAGDGPDATNP